MEDVKRQGLKTHDDWKTDAKKLNAPSNGNLCAGTEPYSNEKFFWNQLDSLKE